MKYNLDLQKIISLSNPNGLYLLGWLWADGSVFRNSKYRRISLEIVKDDMDAIYNYINPLYSNKLPIYNRQRKNRKLQSSLYISSIELYDFLVKYDYLNKNHVSPDKLLKKIPKHLQHYWFLGLFDGDGCFYYNGKHYCKQMSIASSHDQDWYYCENLFNLLNIKKYNVSRRIQGKNRSSTIRISNKRDIELFGNYIYKDNNFTGLDRKYKKFQQIIS